jgi:hypothetical protein
MTTATTTTTEASAPELSQTRDERWSGPLDREDPETDGKARLPGNQTAVAGEAAHQEKENILEMITKTVVAIHQWLAGPPVSAQDRVQHDIAEHANWAHYGTLGGA